MEWGKMRTSLVTASTARIVDLDTMKTHLNKDTDEDDFYIDVLIDSAQACVENITNRKFLTETWKAYTDDWPTYFTLPFGKLQSVTSIKYTDVDGDESTVTASEYIVDIISDPGRIILADGENWPTDNLYPSNPIKVEFVCGYGTPSTVPQPIKSAIMTMITDTYENRGSIMVGTNLSVIDIPGHIMNLLWSYRLFP